MHLATGTPFTRTLDIDYRFSVRLRVNPAVQQAQCTVEGFFGGQEPGMLSYHLPFFPEKHGK